MKHCCDKMEDEIVRVCDQHDRRWDCPDALIHYIPKFNEYGVIIHDGGQSVMGITFCPWCGSRLPESMRDRWFSELEALGFDDPSEEDIPEQYTDDRWHSQPKHG